MKLSDKIITEDDVKDILTHSGFEYVGGNRYWSNDYEEEVVVAITGKTLVHLICWIYRFYSEQERSIGHSYGKSEIASGIKKLLEIK